ncbi:transcription factor bHLH96 [Brachypodium distachyon]|uniref:BHLH domain-containing protein n=1 Tax=Brachypodium distachyon TaxID=15368 RepID=A0A0Q3QAH7_BRADI|nr:transcription factor bHLH96 [Brachypodium distachyon]KQJ98697.1 hypothetical protein BRADI_3g38510v3 [Brachypodium distachyon]|eukprot:XP_010235229.1 transcription factor bHLH96 [Brachypodium distachyon]
MALEAVVFSEGFFGCPAMPASEGPWGGTAASSSNAYGAIEGVLELDYGGNACSWSAAAPAPEELAEPAASGAGRRKRRRVRSVKNVEEVESQRMTHIAVERNRRRQMNDYLAALRSLMPPSYVQRGDQASIIGGAINYVKELEQLLQSLQARRHARRPIGTDDNTSAAAVAPFADFFTFPQYTMRAPDAAASASANDAEAVAAGNADADTTDIADAMVASSGSKQSSVAEIEVTIVESHASLKALTRRRPRQLLRLVAGLQGHRLAVLHLNATGAGHMALYSLSLKVEDDCRLSSVDDIAAAVHRIIETIAQEEQQQLSCS